MSARSRNAWIGIRTAQTVCPPPCADDPTAPTRRSTGRRPSTRSPGNSRRSRPGTGARASSTTAAPTRAATSAGPTRDSTQKALGVQYRSNALAQEKTGEFWVAGKMLTAGAHGDFEHCEVAVFVGKNPWHSHGFARTRVILRDIHKDPNRSLVVIDPRVSETAAWPTTTCASGLAPMPGAWPRWPRSSCRTTWPPTTGSPGTRRATHEIAQVLRQIQVSTLRGDLRRGRRPCCGRRRSASQRPAASP